MGIQPNRDEWVYNFSEHSLKSNVNNAIDFFNGEVDRYNQRTNKKVSAKNFVNKNPRKFRWDRKSINNVTKNRKFIFDEGGVRITHYRPICKQALYLNQDLNIRPGQNLRFFPTPKHQNVVISVTGKGNKKDFSCLISNKIVDFQFQQNTQCFPLYYYDKPESSSIGLLDEQPDADGYVRRDAISDFILRKAQTQYQDDSISKEYIFYYVYGFLHSPEYKETYQDTLKKELPRIPLVDKKNDFRCFSTIGRELADIHLNYESSVEQHPDIAVGEEKSVLSENAYDHYRVQKLKLEKDKTSIKYNENISIHNIPLRAYDYIVNGKSAIEWIVDRYQVKTHKDSQITNNPNDWAKETGNPRYILDLLLSVINLSVKTLDLVEQLPKLE